MSEKFKNWMHRLYPTELEQAIETVIYKFENSKVEDRELIMHMLEQLNEKLEFERFLSYNAPDNSNEGYKVKVNFKNEKYEEQLEQLVHWIHAHNGTYDLVLKRVRAYHEYLHSKSRTAETLKRLADHDYTTHEKENIHGENYLTQVI